MKPTASILIPTYNNPEYLNPCIESIRATGVLNGFCELIIVNNGSQPIKELVKDWPNTKVLEPGKNLGWERGLEFGLKEAQGEFICFQNDDTLIPPACGNFYAQLLYPFQNQNIAAVGPSTTVAAGWHSVFNPQPLRQMSEVSFLIFFTVMVRRSALEAAGGIDTSAPGGDDIDLSIRFRKMGKKLLVNPNAFLIHHAFKTGTRVRGESNVAGGWNSKEMTDKTNQYLIRKHGFKTFLETIRGLEYQALNLPDTEGECVANFVRGSTILELGCGYRKTVPNSIGMDIVPKGQLGGKIESASVADVAGDVTKPLPFDIMSVDTIIARHILEHAVDIVETLKNWARVLKLDGRLIIAVPNEDYMRTIPLNPEHRHGFNPDSLKNIVELLGFRGVEMADPQNGMSFVACFEKVAHLEALPTVTEIQFPEVVHA